MQSLIRRSVSILALCSVFFTAGCSTALESWIVSTRNHQGDLALDSRRYKEAVLAYRLALQIDSTNSHAKNGFVEAEGDYAEMLYAQSHYEEALDELLGAAKVDSQSVRIAGLRSDVENARLKRQIVLSNYPAYEAGAHAIAESYMNLRTTNNEILYRLGRFGHTYDIADLTSAIRGSMDIETEVSKLTTRLINLRAAVSAGSIAPDASSGALLTSGGSILPLP